MEEATDMRAFLANFITENVYFIEEPQAADETTSAADTPPEDEPLAPERTPELERLSLRYHGGNWQQVAIVLSEPEDPRQQPYYPFFVKVLQSVKLTEEGIALVNLQDQPAGYRADFEAIAEELQPQAVLLFGTPEGFAPAKARLYEPAETSGLKLLRAEPLPDIEAAVSKKRQLWNALQLLFP